MAEPVKTVVLLFGEMGAGKSYLGKQMAERQGMLFVEGDGLLPLEMSEHCKKFKAPTKEMLRGLVDNLTSQISYIARGSKSGVVVSQALYLNHHREELIASWTHNGFHVETYWVKTGLWQNLKQLWQRKRGFRWILFWLLNKPFFQKPTHKHIVIHNKPDKG